ncbi:15468_t:CDS:2 [Funneliformis geosporum]|uniref:15468_t:CDS:1 n=1 Tax=Funneliformis geosporum TaxID=1117311 RepID=A0A9W4SUG5_9GLOM|nr:15468_t:CDS:2 [Funneliformis geosporum]
MLKEMEVPGLKLPMKGWLASKFQPRTKDCLLGSFDSLVKSIENSLLCRSERMNLRFGMSSQRCDSKVLNHKGTALVRGEVWCADRSENMNIDHPYE